MKATPLRVPFDNAQKGTGQKWNGPPAGLERFIPGSSLTEIQHSERLLRYELARENPPRIITSLIIRCRELQKASTLRIATNLNLVILYSYSSKMTTIKKWKYHLTTKLSGITDLNILDVFSKACDCI